MDTTDCGPDQNSRKRKILARIHDQQLQAGLCNVIYLPSACLLHQYHLICDTGLKYIDACLSSSTFFSPGENDLKKYFASLAAISNTWREKAAQIISEWEKTFGPSKQGRQFPQHVLQGRWGSVDNAEKFYLSRGREQIQSVLLKAISKHIKADKSGKDKDKGKDKDSNQVLDGDKGTVALADLDETNMYRIKLSKWFATTFQALKSSVFWYLLEVSHKIRSPLRHFLYFTQKYSTPRNSQHILLLLVEKIEEFQKEWLFLALHAPTWIQKALDDSTCSKLGNEVQAKLKMLACKLLLKTGSAFDARILQRLTKHPGL